MRAGASHSTACTPGCRRCGLTAQCVAFLELMPPTLADAIAELAAEGIGVVTVVPVFFGQGGHLRRDFPLLIDACRARHPSLDIRVSSAVGEVDSVLDAIAAYCVQVVAPAASG